VASVHGQKVMYCDLKLYKTDEHRGTGGQLLCRDGKLHNECGQTMMYKDSGGHQSKLIITYRVSPNWPKVEIYPYHEIFEWEWPTYVLTWAANKKVSGEQRL
jgi:hypothetical protein